MKENKGEEDGGFVEREAVNEVGAESYRRGQEMRVVKEDARFVVGKGANSLSTYHQ